MGDREVGNRKEIVSLIQWWVNHFLEQDDCIPSWEESKYIKYTFWASLQSLMKTLGKGKNSHKFCHHEICTVPLTFSIAFYQQVHLLLRHFYHLTYNLLTTSDTVGLRQSSAPSQVSLFLTLWYPNITHVLSRGVKVSILKEVWWKKHLSEVRGLHSASSLHRGTKHWRWFTLQHIRLTHHLPARVLRRNRIGYVLGGRGVF